MTTSRTRFGLAAVCLLLGACDIPTDVPILEHRWQIPVEETSVGVEELLPVGVTVSGSNFDVDVDPITADRSLGSLCPSCVGTGGISVTIPAFSATFTESSPLPDDVSSAVISGGSVEVVIQNGLSFDPIAGGGTIGVTLTDGPGGTLLGQFTVDGDVESLGAGTSLTKTLTIGQSSVSTSVFASITLTSVGGQSAPIDTGDRLAVTATTESLLVSSATVDVNSTTVDLDAVDIDVEDLDSDVTDRIQEGAITFAVTNPFGVAVNGTVNIGPTSKSFAITSAATSTFTLQYSGDELRSFLGQPNVQFSGSGTASGGAVTLSPSDELKIKATLDLILQIG